MKIRLRNGLRIKFHTRKALEDHLHWQQTKNKDERYKIAYDEEDKRDFVESAKPSEKKE